MAWLLLIPAGIIAVLVGVNVGWRWVVAPLLAYAVLRWVIASLRVLAHDAKAVGYDVEPGPVPAGERTFFWCEECETEVLLLVRGSSRAPSHCGQRMHERTELLGD
jgi:hypothetical protein